MPGRCRPGEPPRHICHYSPPPPLSACPAASRGRGARASTKGTSGRARRCPLPGCPSLRLPAVPGLPACHCFACVHTGLNAPAAASPASPAWLSACPACLRRPLAKMRNTRVARQWQCGVQGVGGRGAGAGRGQGPAGARGGKGVNACSAPRGEGRGLRGAHKQTAKRFRKPPHARARLMPLQAGIGATAA